MLFPFYAGMIFLQIKNCKPSLLEKSYVWNDLLRRFLFLFIIFHIWPFSANQNNSKSFIYVKECMEARFWKVRMKINTVYLNSRIDCPFYPHYMYFWKELNLTKKSSRKPLTFDDICWWVLWVQMFAQKKLYGDVFCTWKNVSCCSPKITSPPRK